MTEGMRQHRAFVLTCLLARAKRRTAQEVKVNDVKNKIMQVMTECADQQRQWAQGEYPFRMATWDIRCAMERKFPGVEWKSADLRKELIELAKEGKVSKDEYHSRIGQAVWRLEVKL